MKNILRDLELATKLIKDAGEAVLGYYGGELDVKDKGGDSPLTMADLASDKILKSGLSKTGYGILSEEGTDNIDRLDQDYVWIIDPLDGTKDFIQQTGEFTIMIGLVEKQKDNIYLPILGLIFRPVTNTLYFASKDNGAFLVENGNTIKAIEVSKEIEPRNLVMLTSRNHTTELERQIAEEIGIGKIVSLGSSLKACAVAAGEAHVNFNSSNKTWEWDICASDIIISEAGGKLSDIRGNAISYNKKDPRNGNGYLISNGILNAQIVKQIIKFTK